MNTGEMVEMGGLWKCVGGGCVIQVVGELGDESSAAAGQVRVLCG